MRLAALLLAALAAAPAQVARADSMLRPDQIPQRARELAEKGRKFHASGDYTDAIAAFQEAYALAPSPGLLFNLAQAYRLAGNCSEAAWMYHRYLDTEPSSAQRRLAETHLATVERCAHGTPDLAISPHPFDGKIPAPETEPAAASVERSTRHPVPTRSGREQLGIALGVGGAVLLAGAAYFAYDAWDASSSVSSTYHKGGDGGGLGPTDARGQRSETYAEWLGVGGGLAVASGVTLYLLERRSERAEHFAVVPTPHGAAMHVSWRF